MTRSIAQHANYKVFLDRVYREGDLRKVGFTLSVAARHRATARSRAARRAVAAARRVLALMNK